MSRRVLDLIPLLLILSACNAALAGSDEARTASVRDAEGYAIAACLVGQNQPYLKDQGYGWAEVIIQGGRGEIETFLALNEAVKAELAKGEMVMISDDTAPMVGKQLPILYCHEIGTKPAVRTAITRTVELLIPLYQAEYQRSKGG